MTGNMEHFWVECKTTLPENSTYCWVTCTAPGENRDGLLVWPAFFFKRLTGTSEFLNMYGAPFKQQVIAWMPVPKPFVPTDNKEMET